ARPPTSTSSRVTISTCEKDLPRRQFFLAQGVQEAHTPTRFVETHILVVFGEICDLHRHPAPLPSPTERNNGRTQRFAATPASFGAAAAAAAASSRSKSLQRRKPAGVLTADPLLLRAPTDTFAPSSQQQQQQQHVDPVREHGGVGPEPHARGREGPGVRVPDGNPHRRVHGGGGGLARRVRAERAIDVEFGRPRGDDAGPRQHQPLGIGTAPGGRRQQQQPPALPRRPRGGASGERDRVPDLSRVEPAVPQAAFPAPAPAAAAPSSCGLLFRIRLQDGPPPAAHLDATAPSSPCTPSLHMRGGGGNTGSSSLSAVSPTSSHSEEVAFQQQLEAESRAVAAAPPLSARPSGGVHPRQQQWEPFRRALRAQAPRLEQHGWHPHRQGRHTHLRDQGR
ncbi:unnamed protein product, partial [Ectocarpus fasciculatus]